MKKIAFIAALLVFSTGCKGGLLDRVFSGGIFRGEPCNGSCGYALPAAPAATTGCSDCGTVSAGYGSYDGAVVSDGYYTDPVVSSGTVIDNGYYGSGTVGGTVLGETVSPPMSGIPAN